MRTTVPLTAVMPIQVLFLGSDYSRVQRASLEQEPSEYLADMVAPQLCHYYVQPEGLPFILLGSFHFYYFRSKLILTSAAVKRTKLLQERIYKDGDAGAWKSAKPPFR